MSNFDFSNVPRFLATIPISFISSGDKSAMIIGEQYAHANGYQAALNAMVLNPEDDAASHEFPVAGFLDADDTVVVDAYNTAMRAIRTSMGTIAFQFRQILILGGKAE